MAPTDPPVKERHPGNRRRRSLNAGVDRPRQNQDAVTVTVTCASRYNWNQALLNKVGT
jgi:hypothetical protein